MKFSVVTYYTFLFCLLLASCTTSEECREDTAVNLKIGFYERTLNETTGLYSNSVLSIDSIWVNGLENDSFLYENSKSVSSILLPLKNSSTQSDFVIQFNDKIDTLVIYHENNDQYFLSLECGCIVAHTIQEAVSTNHFIDSISINYPEVNNIDAVHLQIFN